MSSQWSQGVVPPPEGVTPNLVNPPNQLEKNIAIHAVFLTLSTLSVVMRLYTRIHVSRVKLGADDCRHSNLVRSFRWGIGRHMWDEPPAWLVSALMYQTIASQIYLVAATAIKLSLLFLYRRLMNLQTKRTTKYLIDGGIVVILLFNIGLLLGIIFFCIPVQKAWDNSIEGRCSSPAPLSYLSGVWNSLVDIYVLVLPIPLVWGLHMGPRRKLRLAAVFSVGIFACAASIVRLAFTPVLQSDPDSTYNIAQVSIWATLEINIGLICSCLILLPAFLRHHLPESTKSYLRSISVSKSKSKKSSMNDKQDGWQGYHHQVGSDSQKLVALGQESQIRRTDTFTMQSMPATSAPMDLEAGEPMTVRKAF
ncbi:hypothetical protein JX265_003703 [Neoarthrinium moseri]|uniref:Rhodopsin domain-containing protein n=1 Tax=Neoarthrinium moseri TaxID=1658444 RepID=A0A9P9WSC6_9PEZI|nr:uncharacterized protein JN550_002447 [Neoarthrinium moseri]KAI1875018.1 hypothetical protein JN550_002447 [Neoarthrinium moseri]KAI1877695.1 hypothetical protein JX265_003703 [Neoarthrinium moseri]